ncbi:EmrB/QacA family drug resistance transporter [Polymorphobacter multimanifer]|uniref:DHA2 family multidrug resistance protein n=1 Tax=Polymorphobacter multimanifer TaxID=1070431 RepID=A0A841L5Q9_9SPHN|nr:DHA2 family efflux MFS transporter permease subunit [Polymorphobacter multimanifer]MBB6227760.1 DHA2 family multidrug resistance protein [Polymorphobacter multimanifer]GGI76813.1 EmrB/QacA family drug resistance transporter [Polymorphobacter multimanifer]
MTTAALPASALADSGQRRLITLAVMLGTFMTILDSTIANVALPHMQPSLGAAADSVTWVLTSYIVATAIATPLTGWLADRIGRRRLYLFAVAAFTLASMACGLAQSLPEMVLYRILQGATGAVIAPLSQAFILDAWPRARQGQALALFGVGIMVGPILGPVIGGWLTDRYDWRWVFFINLPVGILTILLASAVLPKPASQPRKFDLLGFTLLAIGMGALQLGLDRGHQLDWLASWEVRLEMGLAVAALWAFGVHLTTADNAILSRRLLTDRNVMLGFLFIAIVGVLLVGTTALMPTLLQTLYGYPVVEAGILQMPRGLGMALAMLLAGRLIGKVEPRLVILAGIGCTAAGLWMMTGFAPVMDKTPFITTAALQGFGLGLIFVPLNTIAFSTLPTMLRTEASAFYMLMRNIGGSVGISLAISMLAHQQQTSHADIAGGITAYNTPIANPDLAAAAGASGVAVIAGLDGIINAQALLIAYIDVFMLMFWLTIAMLPLLLLLRPAAGAATPVHMPE